MIYIIYHRYLFTKIQSMRHFFKIIHSFPLLENCDEIGKIWFFFELLLILPIRILGNKTWHVFLSHKRIKKSENSCSFIPSRSVLL